MKVAMGARHHNPSGDALGRQDTVAEASPPRLLTRSRFRDSRFRRYIAPIIEGIIDRKGSCSILDVGGDAKYWQSIDLPSKVKIFILNIEKKDRIADGRFETIQGDARDLRSLSDNSFDFVHSNSLIEHVGRWIDMAKTADEIRRLAPTYYVQTPNFWFPVDPHSNMPFIHWLPHPIQRRLFTTKARGFYKKAETVGAAMSIIDETNMLDVVQMAALFPDARIEFERIAFMNKSLMAVRLQ